MYRYMYTISTNKFRIYNKELHHLIFHKTYYNMNGKHILYTQTQARLVMYSHVHAVNKYIDFLCVRNILSDPQVIETCSRVYFWATESCPASDESKYLFIKL